MQINIAHISSELLDLEEALSTMQATSKGVFATVSDHARALVRHEQAICDLEANAYDSECEDDGGMVDDDYDNDDEDCDDDSDGPAPDCGGATQTGVGRAPCQRAATNVMARHLPRGGTTPAARAAATPPRAPQLLLPHLSALRLRTNTVRPLQSLQPPRRPLSPVPAFCTPPRLPRSSSRRYFTRPT